jgi:TRAP-type C4-dicarboxylate transport system permease small subunit
MQAPRTSTGTSTALDRWLDRATGLIMVLALPIVALLFLQWPLREWAGAGSAQANDAAQALFAVYVAAAIRHAAQRKAHLVSRPDLRDHGGHWLRSLRSAGASLAVLPWALFVCWQGAPTVLRSVSGLERFPETANPGYFLIKVAMLLLAALLALQAILHLWQLARGALPLTRAARP